MKRACKAIEAFLSVLHLDNILQVCDNSVDIDN